MKKILSVFGLLMSLNAAAQTVTQSHIYVCTDASGAVRLNNLKNTSACVERVIKVVTAPMSPKIPAMGDPQPAANALIVSKGVQARRDASRNMILKYELMATEKTLRDLQNDQQTSPSAQTASLSQQIKTAQANIDALQRELAREQ